MGRVAEKTLVQMLMLVCSKLAKSGLRQLGEAAAYILWVGHGAAAGLNQEAAEKCVQECL